MTLQVERLYPHWCFRSHPCASAGRAEKEEGNCKWEAWSPWRREHGAPRSSQGAEVSEQGLGCRSAGARAWQDGVGQEAVSPWVEALGVARRAGQFRNGRWCLQGDLILPGGVNSVWLFQLVAEAHGHLDFLFLATRGLGLCRYSQGVLSARGRGGPGEPQSCFLSPPGGLWQTRGAGRRGAGQGCKSSEIVCKLV